MTRHDVPFLDDSKARVLSVKKKLARCGTVCGLVFCTILSALLALGYQHETIITDGRGIEVRLAADHLLLMWMPGERFAGISHLTFERRPSAYRWPMVFLFSPRPRPPTRTLGIALWIALLLCVVVTLVFFMWGRASFKEGCCSKCGYNLTGNVSGRCPECGAEVKLKQCE